MGKEVERPCGEMRMRQRVQAVMMSKSPGIRHEGTHTHGAAEQAKMTLTLKVKGHVGGI